MIKIDKKVTKTKLKQNISKKINDIVNKPTKGMPTAIDTSKIKLTQIFGEQWNDEEGQEAILR